MKYDFSIGKTNANIFLGATLSASFYSSSEGFSVVNVGIQAPKDIHITSKFSLPIMGKLAVNPDMENILLLFGF